MARVSAGDEECDSRSTRAEPSPTSCWRTTGAASTCSKPLRRPTIRWRAFSRRSRRPPKRSRRAPANSWPRAKLFIHGTTHATNAIVTGQYRENRLSHHEGSPRYSRAARGRAHGAVQLPRAVSQALRPPARSPSRCPSASARTGACTSRWIRPAFSRSSRN